MGCGALIMALYKLQKNRLTGQVEAIIKNPNGSRKLGIPLNEDCPHYVEYLAWVAAGNTAEAAD